MTLKYILPLLLCSVPLMATAQTGKGNLFFSARYDNLSPGGDGVGLAITWLKPLSDALQMELGLAHNDVADSRWTFGIAGAYLRLREGASNVFLRIEHGGGDIDADDFDHTLGRAGITQTLIDRRLYGEAEVQIIRIADVEENLGKLGIGFVPAAGFYAQIAHLRSIFGGEGTRAWFGRLDYTHNATTWFGGAARSTASVDPVSAALGAPPERDQDEYFLGVTLPIKRHALSLVLTHLDGEVADRSSINVVWRWSLDH